VSFSAHDPNSCLTASKFYVLPIKSWVASEVGPILNSTLAVARFAFLFFLLIGVASADDAKLRPEDWAKSVVGSSLGNFYRVSDDLYRSEQPTPTDIPTLKQFGIRTIVSLRHWHTDDRAFGHAGIGTLQYEMNAGSVSVPQLIAVLRLIRAAPKPVLVHCWHGSDRTGFVIAGYRMVFMNWSAEQAVSELRLGGFGLHETWYPNIAKTLMKIDVASVRAAVLNPAAEPAAVGQSTAKPPPFRQ
jgi:tyrosine-protein phosphatase SIW14